MKKVLLIIVCILLLSTQVFSRTFFVGSEKADTNDVELNPTHHKSSGGCRWN